MSHSLHMSAMQNQVRTFSGYTHEPIGWVESAFKQKFAIPRQPGLAPSAEAILHLFPSYATPESVRELEQFSHIWLLFVFHQSTAQGWQPTVRPPKLGGNQRVGVFASRSPFRPNAIGLSATKLLAIETTQGVRLRLGGVDVVDGTPVLDIKPYLNYADSIPGATGGYADNCPSLTVAFTPYADHTLQMLHTTTPSLRALICEVLAQDPRPGYANDAMREYAMTLHQFNIRWRCDGQTVLVIAIESDAQQ